MTLTVQVELPDALAARLLSIPEGPSRDTFVSAALRAQLESLPATPLPDFDWERIPPEKREAARALLGFMNSGHRLGGIRIPREELYED